MQSRRNETLPNLKPASPLQETSGEITPCFRWSITINSSTPSYGLLTVWDRLDLFAPLKLFGGNSPTPFPWTQGYVEQILHPPQTVSTSADLCVGCKVGCYIPYKSLWRERLRGCRVRLALIRINEHDEFYWSYINLHRPRHTVTPLYKGKSVLIHAQFIYQ